TTPLSAAAWKKDLEMVCLLLRYGADPHVQVDGALHPQPLLSAVLSGQSQIVQALLEHGADPNLVDPRDKVTALMLAVTRKDVDSVRVLLAAGADPLLTRF